jgi:hypothetical protein
LKNKVIFSRLTEEQYLQAERVAQATGHTLSDLVRLLVIHAEPTQDFGLRLRPAAVQAETATVQQEEM